MDNHWYKIENADEVDSPALLVYVDRVRENIRRMIGCAGGPERLRPHIKTHKLAEVLRMQMDVGIRKFKCATIAECEMAAAAGADDLLLAYQPVGPRARRFVELVRKFPKTKFACVADDESVALHLSAVATEARLPYRIPVLIDIDCGMHRSGIEPGERALILYKLLGTLPGIAAGGMHVYDGHIHNPEIGARTAECDRTFENASTFRDQLLQNNLDVPLVVCGGTPTFPIHAKRSGVECSPGTIVFWDAGYMEKIPDLDYIPAALVLTRVASKPGGRRICLDLGHKSIASENPHPRVVFPDLPDATFAGHSEEHLVVESDRAEQLRVGDCVYGIPWHICPTVALHSEAVAVINGRAGERWRILARDRRITI